MQYIYIIWNIKLLILKILPILTNIINKRIHLTYDCLICNKYNLCSIESGSKYLNNLILKRTWINRQRIIKVYGLISKLRKQLLLIVEKLIEENRIYIILVECLAICESQIACGRINTREQYWWTFSILQGVKSVYIFEVNWIELIIWIHIVCLVWIHQNSIALEWILLLKQYISDIIKKDAASGLSLTTLKAVVCKDILRLVEWCAKVTIVFLGKHHGTSSHQSFLLHKNVWIESYVESVFWINGCTF